MTDRQQKRRLDFLSRLPMGPRKKSKPDVKPPAVDPPAAPVSGGSPSTAGPSSSVDLPPDEPPIDPPSRQLDAETQSLPPQPANKKNWYGTWNAKAAPVAQLSTNHVGSASSSPNLRTHGSRPERPATPARYMSGSMKRGTRADPLAASLSNVTATPSPKSSRLSLPVDAVAPSAQPAPPSASGVVKMVEDPPLPPDPATKAKEVEDAGANQDSQVQAATGGGWRGWWSKPDKPKSIETTKTDTELAVASKEEATNTPLPGTTPAEETTEQAKGLSTTSPATPAVTTDEPVKEQSSSAQTKSWFWLWSYNQNHRDDPPAAAEPPKTVEGGKDVAETAKPSEEVSTTKSTPKDIPPSLTVAKEDIPKKESPSKPTGWAFWSREKLKTDSTSDTESTHKQIGELAVSGTPSQAKPEEAQFNEREESIKNNKTKAKDKARRSREKNRDEIDTPSKATPSDSPTRKSAEIPGKATETAQIVPPTQTQPTAKPERKNLLFPEFYSTYKLAQQPTYWQQIRRYFLGSASSSPHLSLTTHPVRIKKALAIGVHGYFPAPLIQKVLGQPTGTSIRFANAAAAAIKQWTEERGYEAEIEKVALEGEGFVADRVETLWKLLLNWIDHMRSADFILVACHSQGVPVGIMLVAKLIQFECVNPNVRIGICAMAGVNLGPFPEFRSRFIGGSAAELFDFGRPDSKVSLMYQDALNVVLGRGVKIVYIGSIDDQLVSLESSTLSNISHPLIYRAVFIDTRTHAPNFLTHLIGFVLKLRNLGIPDHGLVRELSPALAGSLYTGEGHSQIYHDAEVFDLAVRHALETTDLSSAEGKINGKLGVDGMLVKWDEVLSVPAERNPYFLPWAMRGVLEEEMVRRELGDECRILLEEFEEWKPTNKVLKDVKFRLEAVKSKL